LATPIVLFDGVCNFCNSSVNFIIARDPGGKFKFSPMQSNFAKSLESELNMNIESSQTIILIVGNKVYTKSRAALEIARKLSGLWPAFYIFIIIPPFIRDFFYQLIARNRYKWFGKRDQCMVPSPEDMSRFKL